MTKFDQPTIVTDADVVFSGRMADLMPAMKDIPEEFKNSTGGKWVKFQQDWFYHGITKNGLTARAGIDKTRALRHLGAIQGSFEPKHEHKEAAVAYLASRWFTDDSTWEVVRGK